MNLIFKGLSWVHTALLEGAHFSHFYFLIYFQSTTAFSLTMVPLHYALCLLVPDLNP